MNTLLWTVQGFVALVFLYSGVMKSTRSGRDPVAMGQTGVDRLPLPLIRFISISELVGVAGLLLPGLLRYGSVLTPIAGLCLGLIMLPAGVIHYRRNEFKAVLFNIFILLALPADRLWPLATTLNLLTVMFKALFSDSITLHLIEEDNLADVCVLFGGYPDSRPMLQELLRHYLPRYQNGRRTNYGFYVLLGDELAGMTLLNVEESPDERNGSTGADMFAHMRGRGITPRTKPHLFYLAFELLGLNRVATGCLISNNSSKRSIEKTAGFQLEGIMRESGVNEQGEFEDEYLYAILKRDWLRLYDPSQVQVIR